MKKYHKYPSTKILKHANILAKLNKLHYGHLPNMTPHGTYSITIHVTTVNLAYISHKQKE